MKYKRGELVVIKRKSRPYLVTEIARILKFKCPKDGYTFFARERNEFNPQRHFNMSAILRYANNRERFLYLMHGIFTLTEEEI